MAPNMEVFKIALSIMAQGMVGIFVVIAIISLIVALMGWIGANTGKRTTRKRAHKTPCFRKSPIEIKKCAP